jgi:hypothetical protein
MDISKAIKEIKLPSKGAPYYSYTSVDGYAWLALAKAISGLDYSTELKIIMEGGVLGLRAPYTISAVGKQCTPTATYTYSCWPVWELANAISSDSLMQRVMVELHFIPFHKTDGVEAGAIDYVSEGCDYLVPNMQALGALMLPKHRQRLLKWLEKNQATNGNWSYTIIATQKKTCEEDVTHLAYIVYVLRTLNIDGVVLERAVRHLLDSCHKHIPEGSAGWGSPFVLQAMRGLDVELEERATIDSIHILKDTSANFRARAVAAWALACRKS